MQAKDIMTTSVATAAPETSVESIAKMMLTRNVSGGPIIINARWYKVLGIVTE